MTTFGRRPAAPPPSGSTSGARRVSCRAGVAAYHGGMSPLSGVLSEAWALYRRHASHFILISFVIFLVISVITALLSWALGTVGALIGLVFSIFGMFLLQAALVKA